jgi:hypothetical protein
MRFRTFRYFFAHPVPVACSAISYPLGSTIPLFIRCALGRLR